MTKPLLNKSPLSNPMLREALAKIRKIAAENRKKINGTKLRIRKLETVAREFKKLNIRNREDRIEKFIGKMDFIEERVSLLNMKFLIASQVEWVSRGQFGTVGFTSVVLRAFDEPDEWWTKREHYTLDHLLGELLILKKKYDKEDLVQKEDPKFRTGKRNALLDELKNKKPKKSNTVG